MKSEYHRVAADVMREGMRQWATGVTIVTSLDEGWKHGMTVSSFTSISLDPPLVLVSLSRQARTHALVEKSGVFGVTILNDQQEMVSDRFAGRMSEDEDRFVGLEIFTLITGAPFLAGGLAFFDCRVEAAYEVGDHTLFLGEVIASRAEPNGKPLIYYNRSYQRLQ
ncbi:MAG: flavin reductase family protein [Anaerolineales bacterium]|nr:flavin reductase family protein [Anaerolineales bacterium]